MYDGMMLRVIGASNYLSFHVGRNGDFKAAATAIIQLVVQASAYSRENAILPHQRWRPLLYIGSGKRIRI